MSVNLKREQQEMKEKQTQAQTRDVAQCFKAFSDERRVIIISALAQGEKCACTLLESLEISQSTLSHHMKILIESGVVESRREGKWTYYSLCTEGLMSAQTYIQNLIEAESRTESCHSC